jgi:hypothetical protein
MLLNGEKPTFNEGKLFCVMSYNLKKPDTNINKIQYKNILSKKNPIKSISLSIGSL